MTGCEIVPPYLLAHLAEHTDDPELRDRLRAHQELDRAIRERRAQHGKNKPSPRAARPDRVIYDAQNGTDLPGVPVRAEGEGNTGDQSVTEAYSTSGLAWELFQNEYGFDSYDGSGHRIDATVHYARDYNNAFWDGEQLVFGDGDGKVFDRFTKPPGVVAHEYVHAVTQHTAGLGYQDQAGALNESISDVFAALTVQRVKEQSADEASWLIGRHLFMPGINGVALRSMKEPGTAYDDPRIGKDPQPGHMDDFVVTDDDNGGVHINSGIPNRAFYLVAKEIGGPAWKQAGAIWFATLTDSRLQPDADFAQYARLTAEIAAERFGADSPEARAVRAGWDGVGVRLSPVGNSQPGAGQGRRIAVRRSGGFAGIPMEASLDTGSSQHGAEVEELLDRVDLFAIPEGDPQPDAFVYAVEVDGQKIVLHERNLTPDAKTLIDLVLQPDA